MKPHHVKLFVILLDNIIIGIVKRAVVSCDIVALQIAECFADCLGGLLSVVGQNMTLTIETQPHCTLGTVHYKNKPQMEPDNKK